MLDAFTEAGAAIGPVYNAQDIVEDPHVRETEMLVEVDDEDLGTDPAAQRHVAADRQPRADPVHRAGALGQDTDEVLTELGCRPTRSTS